MNYFKDTSLFQQELGWQFYNKVALSVVARLLLCLAVVLDPATRRTVGWSINERMKLSRPRFGYQHIQVMLRDECLDVNQFLSLADAECKTTQRVFL